MELSSLGYCAEQLWRVGGYGWEAKKVKKKKFKSELFVKK